MFKDNVRQYIEAYVTASRRDGGDLVPWLSRAHFNMDRRP
jgi:hypothetical protein